jgi:TP901 family phage tail tape measure protein
MNLDAVLRIAAKVTGVDQIEKLAGGLNNVNQAATGARKSFQGVTGSAAWQGAAVAATGFGVAIGVAASKAINFESAIADVRKVVDGVNTPQGLKDIRAEIIGLSQEMPITAEGFAAIYAAAGEAGIARGEIQAFAKDVAKMSIAFDMSAEDAGSAMAKMRSSLGLSQDKVRSLGDALNHLSNNTASSARELVNFTARSGAIGQMAGLSAEQTAAYGAAMISAGIEAEVAATSFNNMIKALSRGESMTARQESAFESLGLSTGALAKNLQENAVGTIQSIFDKIKGLSKEQRVGVISNLFGDEARGLAPIIQNSETLAKALQSVGDKTKYADSMAKEYDVRSQTSANALQLAKNNFDALAISVGATVVPALTKLVQLISPVISGLARFAEANPVITALAVGVAGLVAAFVLLAPALVAAGTLLAPLMAGVAGIAAAITSLGGIVSVLGMVGASLAALVTWPVLIAAGIVAAVAVIFTFREQIGAFFTWLGGLWVQSMTTLGEIGYTLFLEPWVKMWNLLKAPAVSIFNSIVNTVKIALNSLITFWGNVVNGIIRIANNAISGFNRVSPIKVRLIPEMTVPRFAQGGFVTGPTLAMLGDNRSGQEYAVPAEKALGFANNILAGRRGAAAIPSSGSSGGGGGSGPITVAISLTTGPVMEHQGQRYVTLEDAERIARATAKQTVMQLRTPGGRRAAGIR